MRGAKEGGDAAAGAEKINMSGAVDTSCSAAHVCTSCCAINAVSDYLSSKDEERSTASPSPPLMGSPLASQLLIAILRVSHRAANRQA